MLKFVLEGAPIVAAENDKPLTARPAVKLATDTLSVVPLWFKGTISLPDNGVDAELNPDIFVFAID